MQEGESLLTYLNRTIVELKYCETTISTVKE
jgi:hypothetical protein